VSRQYAHAPEAEEELLGKAVCMYSMCYMEYKLLYPDWDDCDASWSCYGFEAPEKRGSQALGVSKNQYSFRRSRLCNFVILPS